MRVVRAGPSCNVTNGFLWDSAAEVGFEDAATAGDCCTICIENNSTSIVAPDQCVQFSWEPSGASGYCYLFTTPVASLSPSAGYVAGTGAPPPLGWCCIASSCPLLAAPALKFSRQRVVGAAARALAPLTGLWPPPVQSRGWRRRRRHPAPRRRPRRRPAHLPR